MTDWITLRNELRKSHVCQALFSPLNEQWDNIFMLVFQTSQFRLIKLKAFSSSYNKLENSPQDLNLFDFRLMFYTGGCIT